MSHPNENLDHAVNTSSSHFRLVPDGHPEDANPAQIAEPSVPSMISAALLVSEAEFAARAADMPRDCRLACASVPLIASLARIRSDADAAIALTGVIETLARQFHIQLPCGAMDDGAIGMIVPSKVDLAQVAQKIDDSLAGQVRATDLQGALKDQMEARITPMTPL